jgi:hypothetical protein
MNTCKQEGCNKTLRRKDTQFCSRACYLKGRAAKQKRAALPPKVCVVCGDEFHQTVKESPNTFLRRSSCGRSCGARLSNIRRRRKAADLGRNHKYTLPDSVVDNWTMLAPTCTSVMNLLHCGDGTAYKVAHRHGLSFAGERNGNLFCLNNFVNAEKAYARYAAKGLHY